MDAVCLAKVNCQRTRVGLTGVEPATSRLRAGCFAFQLHPQIKMQVIHHDGTTNTTKDKN